MITYTLVLIFVRIGSSNLPIAATTIQGFGTEQACKADGALLAERYQGSNPFLDSWTCVPVGSPAK